MRPHGTLSTFSTFEQNFQVNVGDLFCYAVTCLLSSWRENVSSNYLVIFLFFLYLFIYFYSTHTHKTNKLLTGQLPRYLFCFRYMIRFSFEQTF